MARTSASDRPADGSSTAPFSVEPCDGKRIRAGMDDRAALIQARSMLILLLAASKQTQVALEAAANALDTDLRNDLAAMIERTEAELVALVDKIEALPA